MGDLEESNRGDALARNSIEKDKEDKEYGRLEKLYFTEKKRLEEAIYIASSNLRGRRRIIDDIENEKAEIRRIKQEAIDSVSERFIKKVTTQDVVIKEIHLLTAAFSIFVGDKTNDLEIIK